MVLNSNRHTLWQLHLPPLKTNKQTNKRLTMTLYWRVSFLLPEVLSPQNFRWDCVVRGSKPLTDQDKGFRLPTSDLIHVSNSKSHSISKVLISLFHTRKQHAPYCRTKLSKSNRPIHKGITLKWEPTVTRLRIYVSHGKWQMANDMGPSSSQLKQDRTKLTWGQRGRGWWSS